MFYYKIVKNTGKNSYSDIFRMLLRDNKKVNIFKYRNFSQDMYKPTEKTGYNSKMEFTSNCYYEPKYLNNFSTLCKRLHTHTSNKCQSRAFSSHNQNDFPELTSFPVAHFPNFLQPISSILLTYLVVKPYIDCDFKLFEFVKTTKKVVEVVSQKLSSGDVDDLKGLIAEDVLNEIKRNLTKFSVSQREELNVNSEDICTSLISSMNIIQDETENSKHLQITTIHHAIKGFQNFQINLNLSQPFNLKQSMFNLEQEKLKKQEPRKPFILNYRFIRKYSASSGPGDWIINGLNHVKFGASITQPPSYFK